MRPERPRRTGAIFGLALLGSAALAAGDGAAWTRALRDSDLPALARIAQAGPGVDVDQALPGGKTALMIAAREGDDRLVGILLAAGADPRRANDRGGTALMYAAHGGHAAAAERLIEGGADVEARAGNGWTALTLAAAKGEVDVAKVLLRHHALVNQPDLYGWTPLMRAIYAGYYGVADVLLDSGRAALDAREESGASVLHLAAIRLDERAARMLLAAGADPALKDNAGRTAADVARMQGNVPLARLLSPRSGQAGR